MAAGQDLTLVGKDINLIARQDTQDTQNSESSKSSGFSMVITYDPTKAYRSARDSTTGGMADSGSIMGDITRMPKAPPAACARPPPLPCSLRSKHDISRY